MGHMLMGNPNGVVVDAMVTTASGTEKRQAAVMIDKVPGKYIITVGDYRGYSCKDFVEDCRKLKATAHVAQKAKGSSIDGRTTRHKCLRYQVVGNRSRNGSDMGSKQRKNRSSITRSNTILFSKSVSLKKY